MVDFQFLQNPISKEWVVLAPRRAKRPARQCQAMAGGPDITKGAKLICPFCLSREKDEKEVFRIGGEPADSNWQVRVLPNKFPFTPIHEVIIHSPDHHKNFGELTLYQIELIIKTYRQRYLTHQKKGQVYIFHNRGEGGGESLPHPHTQLTVIPPEVEMDIQRLDPLASVGYAPKAIGIYSKDEDLGLGKEAMVETPYFYLFCPQTSQWPDEVWVAPKNRGRFFGEIIDGEVSDLAYIISRIVQIFDLRHGHKFPFNFYIYPGGDWYLRLIPRLKTLGGFEIGTGVFVNTQDPKETITFLKKHFERPDEKKIKREFQAGYGRSI